jgi:predicted nucleic acid-binding protein
VVDAYLGIVTSSHLREAVEDLPGSLFGHQQVTDAYLLGLALRKKGKLVTLDRGVKSLARPPFDRCLEIID